MKGFLSIDSKFYKYMTFFSDLVILTVLWTICSLPIITSGAATTAMYYVLTRQLSDREGYVGKDFFRSFRQNFVQATFLTIISLVMAWIIYININNMQTSSFMFPVQFVLCYELIITMIYIFPILSRFDNGVFGTVKAAIYMANKHLLTTFTCLGLMAALVIFCYYQPIMIVVCAGVYGWLTSLMFMKVFKKYLPSMDIDPSLTNAEVAEKEAAEREREEMLRRIREEKGQNRNEQDKEVQDKEVQDKEVQDRNTANDNE